MAENVAMTPSSDLQSEHSSPTRRLVRFTDDHPIDNQIVQQLHNLKKTNLPKFPLQSFKSMDEQK